MDINWDLVRVGEMFHTGKQTMEISRPVRMKLNNEGFEIWGFSGDLMGEMDYTDDKLFRQEEILEPLTKDSMKKYLRQGVQYEAGLEVGIEDLSDFLRQKAYAWHEGSTRDAILELVVKYEQKLQKDGWPKGK